MDINQHNKTMKTIVHQLSNTEVNISKHTENELIGTFFNEKPEVGTIFMSHAMRDKNFLYMFLVTPVTKNRDAKICKTCTHSPEKAYFELEIEDVTGNPEFSGTNNSVKEVLKF